MYFYHRLLGMAKKRNVREMTDEQILKKIFPKKVREELKRVAHEKDSKPPKKG